jgi:hypothetical protein
VLIGKISNVVHFPNFSTCNNSGSFFVKLLFDRRLLLFHLFFELHQSVPCASTGLDPELQRI